MAEQFTFSIPVTKLARETLVLRLHRGGGSIGDHEILLANTEPDGSLYVTIDGGPAYLLTMTDFVKAVIAVETGLEVT